MVVWTRVAVKIEVDRFGSWSGLHCSLMDVKGQDLKMSLFSQEQWSAWCSSFLRLGMFREA